jgi:hypothetical protein
MPAMPVTISILNTVTNTLALFEPTVNDKRVDLQLKEIEAGRSFALTVNFPQDSRLLREGKVEVSVKSNHPQFSTIKVPVIQAPRQTPSVAPLATPAALPSPSAAR